MELDDRGLITGKGAVEVPAGRMFWDVDQEECRLILKDFQDGVKPLTGRATKILAKVLVNSD